MPRVIQKLNLQKRFNFALHRGPDKYSSDPYSNRRIFRISRCSGVGYAIGFSASALLLLFTLLAVAPITAGDDTVEAAATGTASTITVTTSSPTASLELGAVTIDGKFATSSASELAIFGVQTTNYTGYTLTIAAPDDTGTLVNNDTSITSNNTFSSITSPMDENTFDDASYNGYWGYKPSKIGGVDNVSFQPSPTTAATILDVTSSANPTDFNMYTIALGARASYSQAAGTYSKTMSLVATANPITYSVSYRDNTGDTVTNLPDGIVESATTRTTTTETEIILSSVTPSRAGYAFAGWCDATPTSNGTVCSGTTYAAGSTYGIDQTTTNTIVLYALWSNNSYGITINTVTGIESVSLNGWVCTSTCTVPNLEGGKSYVLTAVPSDHNVFTGWTKTNPSSVISDATASTTTYTVDGNTDTITPSVASGAKGVTVNFSYAGGGTAGVSSVVFKESATGVTVGTVSASGGSVNLYPGVGYTVTTNAASGYGIKSYAATSGTIADTASTNSTNYFIPNSSTATITVNTCLKTIPTTTMQAYNTNIDYLCDDATGTLTDSRDSGKSYTVGVVTSNNGRTTSKTLWMTKNLSIGCNTDGTINQKTLTNSDSNVASSYTTPATSGHSNTYTDSKIVCSNNGDYGAWYNYVAATAGTINTADNSTEASASVCPKGWKLPSHSQISAAASNWEAFSPVTGGYYNGGTLNSTGSGRWWSTLAGGGTNRWYLDYNGSYLSTTYTSRYYGFYVRCVKS